MKLTDFMNSLTFDINAKCIIELGYKTILNSLNKKFVTFL